MANEFPKIDFGFRYGSKRAIDNTTVKNGTFNIATDLDEIFVDIKNSRISTKSLYFYNTELEILSEVAPVTGKLYYAINTNKLYAFDWTHARWVQIGGSLTDIYNAIDQLTNVVNAIHSFEIIVLGSGESLPEVGTSHIIYFVPRENSDPDTVYDEFVWIESAQYYEKIGISTPELSNYYTKSEVDTKVSSATSRISTLETAVGAASKPAATSIRGRLNTVESSVSTNSTSISTLKSTIGNLDPTSQGYITIASRLTTLESASGGSTADLTEFNAKLGNMGSSTDPGFKSVQERLTTLEGLDFDFDFGLER